MNKDLGLFVSTTLGCNLACPHCYQRNGKDTPKGSSHLAETRELIERNPNITHITLLGGEAFLNKSVLRAFLDMGRRIKKQNRKFSVSVITNGTVYWPWLKEYQDVMSGGFQVSLDGGPSYHDSVRKTRSGDPTFALVTDNARKYLDDGFNVVIHMVYDTRRTDEFCASLLEYAKVGDKRIQFNFEIARTGENLNYLDVRRSLRKVYKVAEGLRSQGFTVHPTRGVSRGSTGGISPCTAGTSFLGVNAQTGVVHACHDAMGTDKYVVGTIGHIEESALNEYRKLQNRDEYYVEGFPRWYGKWLAKRHPMTVCWSENIDVMGDWRCIPRYLYELYKQSRKHSAWRDHDFGKARRAPKFERGVCYGQEHVVR